jgi:hypothetical protein
MSVYLNETDEPEYQLSESLETPEGPKKVVDENRSLKRGIWIYFLLLIFEGAFRKWFLPGLTTPLLVVRDPVAIWLIYMAWKRNLLPANIYLVGVVLIGFIGAYLAMVAGHGNLVVALYGARIFILHFPLIFVFGNVFTREDVEKMGIVTLLIAVPMAVLIAMQFHSPQSAWVNRGLGNDESGGGFVGTADFFRPPGTFSFTSGTSLFFGFVAPFVFYFWLHQKKVNRLLLIAASGALLASIPFSISRTLLGEVALTGVFTVIGIFRNPKHIGKVIISIVAGVALMAVLSQTKYFRAATGAFSDRFTTANEVEGGLVKGVIGDRFFGGLFGALQKSGDQPFLGLGIGMGTNVGSQLLAGGKVFLIDELEWGRLIGELGPLFGILLIFLRVALAFKLTIVSYQKLGSQDFLPWLLLSFVLIPLTQGQWATPTALGFAIVSAGLLVASLNHPPVAD